jgi:hypothetical protein
LVVVGVFVIDWASRRHQSSPLAESISARLEGGI